VGYTLIEGASGQYITSGGVFDENGVMLFQDGRHEVVNGADKFIAGKDVYALPGFVVEHTYPYGVQTVKLNDDDYYFYEDNSTGYIHVFDGNHTPYAQFGEPVVCNDCTGFYLENQMTSDFFDQDPGVERFYLTVNFITDTYTLTLYDDDGQVLFERVHSDFLLPILARAGTLGFTANRFVLDLTGLGTDSMLFFNPLNFVLNAGFPSNVYPLQVEGNTYKLAPNFLSGAETSFSVFNTEDLLHWKTFARPNPADEALESVTQTVFNADLEYEVGSYNENGYRITNEAGNTTIFELPVYQCFIDRLPGAANKLFCAAEPEDPAEPTLLGVYGFPSSTPLPTFQPAGKMLKATVSPNPVADRAVLRLEEPLEEPMQVELLDGTGRITASWSVPAGHQTIEIPGGMMPVSVLYFVHFRSGRAEGMTRLVKN
jgi:hypothetical protein